jgi:hypothetical protein
VPCHLLQGLVHVLGFILEGGRAVGCVCVLDPSSAIQEGLSRSDASSGCLGCSVLAGPEVTACKRVSCPSLFGSDCMYAGVLSLLVWKCWLFLVNQLVHHLASRRHYIALLNWLGLVGIMLSSGRHYSAFTVLAGSGRHYVGLWAAL